MNKILIILTMMFFATVAQAKDKLYILNSASACGSFNAQMTAYADGLEPFYDITYVQGKGCAKATANIKKITDNGYQVLYIWNGLRTADFRNGKNDLCTKHATPTNFVNSVLKYAVFFTKKNGINKEDIFKEVVKVGYNSSTNQAYLQALMAYHGVDWQLVRYENSKGVTLAVMNEEVDFGMINSAKSYWKDSDKLKALYTLNKKGENGITPLASVSGFAGADDGIADMFLLEGGDNKKMRKHIASILNNPDSKISKWYAKAKGYTQTIDMSIVDGIAITEKQIANWVK